MTSLARAGAAYRAGPEDAEDAAMSAKAGGAGILAQDEDEAEGDRLNGRVEKRIMDIETGRVKMKRYTADEYMRHLDDILGG